MSRTGAVLLLAIGSALMALATVLYMTHRDPEVRATLVRNSWGPWEDYPLIQPTFLPPYPYGQGGTGDPPDWLNGHKVWS